MPHKTLNSLKNNMMRKIKFLFSLFDSAQLYFFTKLHKLICYATGKKPKHLILLGPEKSGIEELYNCFNHCSSKYEKAIPQEEASALKTVKKFSSLYITKCYFDLFRAFEIKKKLSSVRDLKFIVVVKNPKDLLTFIHESAPWQYYQSWDFSFYIHPYPSFTKPGVGKAFAEIEKLQNSKEFDFKVIRYEDFLANPEKIQKDISDFTGINFNLSFSNYISQLKTNKLRIKTDSIQVGKFNYQSNTSNHTKRLQTLYALYPEIKETMKKYGYSNSENKTFGVSTKPSIKHGIVVGMYTPDETYRNEAKRMQASLDRLGINHSLDELPPVEEVAIIDDPDKYPAWFIQKLARYHKPAWLRKKREQIHGPMLYCDVDAFFHKNPWPYLSLYDGDIAVFSRRDGKVNSGTIWINDTPGALKILKDWDEFCQSEREIVREAWPDIVPSTSDQPLLQKIVENNYLTNEYKVQQIPLTMIRIFDRHSSVENEVFIEHLQASRVAKGNNSQSQTTRTIRVKQLENLTKNS